MDYRLVLEEAAKFKKELGLSQITLDVEGRKTKKEVKAIQQEVGAKKATFCNITDRFYLFNHDIGVHFTGYAHVPVDDKIAELEQEIAKLKLKGEVAHA